MGREFPRFRFRRFVTNVLVLSFLVSAVSGVILFFRPEGSLARWVGWSVFGLDKAQWEALHLVFVGVFLVVSIVHVWYNWTALVSYLRQKAAALTAPRSVPLPSREFLAAIGVALAVFAGTLVDWQPFSEVLALRSAVKDGAFVDGMLPPVPNADRQTFADLCRMVVVPEAQAVKHVRSRGIDVPDPSVTIGEIARAHDVPPATVYRAILDARDSRSVHP